MNTKSPYFQFPLCLLAYESGIQSRMCSILNYCLITAGRAFEDKQEFYALEDILNAAEESLGSRMLEHFDRDDSDHCSILLGMRVLGVERGAAPAIVRGYEQAAAFCEETQAAQGTFPSVRIKASYFWETLNDGPMTYREFSILCAIYAILGNKDYPYCITRDRIRAGALGYKRASTLFDSHSRLTREGERLLALRNDKQRPLTTDQVRYTLDCLAGRGFFARVHASPRQSYFSHRMKRDQMEEWLFLKKTKPSKLTLNRQADHALQARIRAAKRTL